MPKFLVTHPVPIPSSPEETDPIGKAFKTLSNKDAYWIKSWGVFNEEGKLIKIFCQWDAKDINSIKQIIDKVNAIPTESIFPMSIFHSEDFR